MRILRLRIRNFRGINEANVLFDEHTVLIGPNGSGKSTLIEALALIFGRDRLVRSLTEHDFFLSNPNPQDRISLIATIGGFTSNDPDLHRDWFRDGRAVEKWWDPNAKTLLPTKSSAQCLLSAEIGFCARFDRDTLTVETLRYFHDDDGLLDAFDADRVASLPAHLIGEVGFFLIPSARTWDRTISFGSEIFRRFVGSIGGLPSDEIIAERDRLRTPADPLENVGNFGAAVSRINAELERLLPGSPRLHFRVTSTDTESLLQSLTPHYDYRSDALLPAARHGSGLLSLQTMLLLLEFARTRRESNKSFILAIEEPELHIPPGFQARIVYRTQMAADQSISTTHSPRVAGFYAPHKVQVLRNDNGILEVMSLSPGPLGDGTPNAIRKLLLDNRRNVSMILRHKVVFI
jgi:energy-coupling factor transporter ATP-binding protein EcfA2